MQFIEKDRYIISGHLDMEESNTEIKNNYNNNEGTDLNSQVTATPDLVVQQSLNKL